MTVNKQETRFLEKNAVTGKATLISPYGGELVDLLVRADMYAEIFSCAAGLASIQLTRRQTCDLEMLATGAFSPLRGFMSESDHNRVLDEMRLSDGTIFPIPITLSTDDLTGINIGGDIALRDLKNDLLALMKVEEIYEWDRTRTADAVFGTTDPHHPLIAEMAEWGRFNLSGKLQVLKLPEYHDFCDLRLTPTQTRARLQALGREDVVAFQTRNPMHRAHEAMTQKAIDVTGGTLLLHPAVGMTKNGDIDHFTRVRTYMTIAALAYPKDRVLLSLAPLAMRMAGPREAVWHAIIRRNYGAKHFIVGRDHASPGTNAKGAPFYEAYAAQNLACELSSEIGVNILPFQELAYLPDDGLYEEAANVQAGRKVYSLSGARLREDISRNGDIPEWLVRRQVAEIVVESYRPRTRQGVCLWFTGLSGAGKSTTAEIVTAMLLEEGRRVTLLDGDVVRTNLSKGLGFSKEDREINVRRIGFVASEVVKHGGIAVCAAVSPYRESRRQVRSMFAAGQFIEVFVNTPLNVCEARDAKGMYARARRGEIANFTGINDVYEEPESAEISLETVDKTARENAQLVIDHLKTDGFLKQQIHAANGFCANGG